ncbi:unnamed protein product [Amaranthus hypochondriacus]
MPSLFNLFSCFPVLNQVGCEQDQPNHIKVDESSSPSNSKEIKRSSAPIVVSYFPVGARFSRL